MVLEALRYTPTPEGAHQLLTDVGYWLDTPLSLGFANSALSQALDLQQEVVQPVKYPRAADPLHGSTRVVKNVTTYTFAHAAAAEPLSLAVGMTEMRGKRVLMVHIVDVARKVPVDSDLDRDVAGRASSVSSEARHVPLFPVAACQGLQLQTRRRNYAITVAMQLDGAGKVTQAEIYLADVQSAFAMPHHMVNQVLRKQHERLTTKLSKRVIMDLFNFRAWARQTLGLESAEEIDAGI